VTADLAPRHGATILRMRPWFYWTCTCGAQSGPPYYRRPDIASQAWAEHVAEAEAE
jgi:hypothetical protein